MIYKMVGPVLLKQDQLEAKTNVDKRIEFIQSEMWVVGGVEGQDSGRTTLTTKSWSSYFDRKRVEGQLKDINLRSEKKRLEVSICEAQGGSISHAFLIIICFPKVVAIQEAAQRIGEEDTITS